MCPRRRKLARASLALLVTLAGLAAFVHRPAEGATDGARLLNRSDRMTNDGRVVLITGSTDGLGREVARRIASTGAHVIIHGRNQERGLEVVREIEAEGVGSARFYPADLASLDQVRRLAAAIQADYERIDILINNAGIWSRTAAERQLSADGHEIHFAVNYLSGYLLTRLLLPMIVESAPSRIINVASVAQNPIDFRDPMLENGYSGGRAYGQSKLAQILFTMDLAEELRGTGVTVVALHPATLMDTNMVAEAGMSPRATVDEGADAVMSLVTAPDLESGQYFDGQRATRANDQAYDVTAREALRALSAELTGI